MSIFSTHWEDFQWSCNFFPAPWTAFRHFEDYYSTCTGQVWQSLPLGNGSRKKLALWIYTGYRKETILLWTSKYWVLWLPIQTHAQYSCKTIVPDHTSRMSKSFCARGRAPAAEAPSNLRNYNGRQSLTIVQSRPCWFLHRHRHYQIFGKLANSSTFSWTPPVRWRERVLFCFPSETKQSWWHYQGKNFQNSGREPTSSHRWYSILDCGGSSNAKFSTWFSGLHPSTRLSYGLSSFSCPVFDGGISVRADWVPHSQGIHHKYASPCPFSPLCW